MVNKKLEVYLLPARFMYCLQGPHRAVSMTAMKINSRVRFVCFPVRLPPALNLHLQLYRKSEVPPRP